MSAADAGAAAREPTEKEIRLVIAASSAGTIFEWYDFFIYGTLAGLIGAAFFPAGNETLQILLVWAGFAVGFGFRPLGAIMFGFLGDRLGRKYTFIATVTLMGIATAGVGLIPSAATIGLAAPIIVIAFRILQGLALGGEYGGAAIYVAEHAPPEKRGFYTSFIQASVVGGFALSASSGKRLPAARKQKRRAPSRPFSRRRSRAKHSMSFVTASGVHVGRSLDARRSGKRPGLRKRSRPCCTVTRTSARP